MSRRASPWGKYQGKPEKAYPKDPLERRRLESLDPIIEKKLTELKNTIDARRTRGFQAASDMVMTHLGKKLMRAIRK